MPTRAWSRSRPWSTLVLGIGEFSAMSADRDVIEDDEAYLGVETEEYDRVVAGQETTAFGLENRLGVELDDVEVRITDGDGDVENVCDGKEAGNVCMASLDAVFPLTSSPSRRTRASTR